MENQSRRTVFLRKDEVLKRTGIGSESTLYKMIREQRFPAGIPLGDGARAVGFLESEVEAWCREQVAKARARR